MTKTKFTPGPWTYTFNTIRDDWGEIRRADGRLVAKCVFGWWTDDELNEHRKQKTDPAAANAALIASAPDMYAALEAAIECGLVPKSSAHEGGAMRHARQVEVADMIRAALSKARGES